MAIIEDIGGIIEEDTVLGDMVPAEIEEKGRMVRKKSLPRILTMGRMNQLCAHSRRLFSWKARE
jgi:hypothetical protein